MNCTDASPTEPKRYYGIPKDGRVHVLVCWGDHHTYEWEEISLKPPPDA